MDKEYVRVFRAFTDESRVRVLALLREGEQCACVLLYDLKISQPTLSHHMKILCASGLVKSRRAGRWNYYSLNTEGCQYASRLLNAIAGRRLEDTLNMMRALHRSLRPIKTLLGRKAPDQLNQPGPCCCAHHN